MTDSVTSSAKVAIVPVTLTRPSNTNAYSTYNVISNATSGASNLTFSNMAKTAGGSGLITYARLITNQWANTSQFKLHLFNVNPTAINDASPFTFLWANRATGSKPIAFPACATEGSGSDSAYSIATPGVGNMPVEFQCATGDMNLYGILEVLGAFTPASGQQFYIELTVEQN